MKKRVGIITKHCIFNYGSFMQAYATQRIIEKLGYDVEIIDYKYPNAYHGTNPSLKGQLLHEINYHFKNLLPGKPGKSWEEAYKRCFDKYYKQSKHYCSHEEIMKEPPTYDIYVVGSDQLWRPEFTNGDPVFFADFAPEGKKRISYASSFGCLNIPVQYKADYKRMLNALDAVSVRERSGCDIVESLTGRKAELVADPSLLLTAEEWKRIMEKPRITKPYMICYGNMGIDYINDIAIKLVGNQDIEIVRTNGKFIDYFNKKIHYLLDVGPLEWLGLLANAEFVLAGSFHGTAFSIQFHRPFMSVLTGNSDHDDRQKCLLSELNLEGNALYIGNKDTDDIRSNMLNIDWLEIDKRLQSLRSCSLRYLESSLM